MRRKPVNSLAFGPRKLTGALTPEPSARELENAALSREAAAQSFVLLKNDGLLPLKAGAAVALYGYGASRTIKGGTGSGDVNERYCVSLAQGLENAGYNIVNREQIDKCDAEYMSRRIAWRDSILKKWAEGDNLKFFEVYSVTAFTPPVGEMPLPANSSAVGVYVLSRQAGENYDRSCTGGDYLLSDEEHELLAAVCRTHEQVLLVINSGGVVDLSCLDEFEQIKSVLLIGQPGMEGGNAAADVISGRINPSGRLTDTWAMKYSDYPASADMTSGHSQDKYYREGIFVGYRWFDSFGIKPRFCFGHGLSYTDFEIKFRSMRIEDQQVFVTVRVRNTGKVAGSQVVQVYASCPQTSLVKEFRRLVTFGKTVPISPGQLMDLEMSFPICQLASFSESESAWIMEPGAYVIWVGGDLDSSEKCAWINMKGKAVLERTEHICPLQQELEEILPDVSALTERLGGTDGLVRVTLYSASVKELVRPATSHSTLTEQIISRLTREQLISLMTGDPAKGQSTGFEEDGIFLPGSAGETSSCAEEQGLVSIVLADGPAGLRLNRHYDVDNGVIIRKGFTDSLEGGFFAGPDQQRGERHYQYCTGFPVGVLLAQSWDLRLMDRIGKAVAGEMLEFGVTLWLAPGMNIHRDPLCGRNFEYYSEDPLLSGVMAAAITNGVQSVAGCGTTIKHFACNNSEDNRYDSDSVLSERALREIYLRGFEIAIRSSQPMAIMTSYNLINGVHAANCRDICTQAARNEWGFAGLIMTDWCTTFNSPRTCTAAGCTAAGNDLIMPGVPGDWENIRQALDSGALSMEALKAAAENIVEICRQSARYSGGQPYAQGLPQLMEYVKYL